MPARYFLSQGVPNIGGKVVAGLNRPFCKIRPLLGTIVRIRDPRTKTSYASWFFGKLAVQNTSMNQI
jgi:hypothetical protein